MADISKEIKAFQDAVYGEEVRGSMISLAEKVNTEVEAGTEKVTEYGKSESARAQAEKDRAAAENLRKSAETKRAQDFAVMQQASEDATDAANTAASNANSKASLANTAAGSANAAAGAANTAASGANAAKQTALQAAAEAEEATEAANTAATNANSKASLADTAAGNASTAADRANEAAEAAEGLVLGDISGKTVTFEMAIQRANIQSNDSLAVAFGKLAKFCADLDDHAFSAPVPNLLSDDSTKSLAASMGKALKTDIGDLTQLPTTAKGSLVEAITEQNSALAIKTYSPSKIGITNTTSLNQIIEGGKLPAGSLLEFWINNNTTYGSEISEAIQHVSGNVFYGYCFIYRTLDGRTRFIKCIRYNDWSAYVNLYTEINSVGWMSNWKKV